MEDYGDLLSDHSDDEEACYSDEVDSDIEAELYGLIHHDTHSNSISLEDKSVSVEIEDQSDSVGVKSVSLQDNSGSKENNSVFPQNGLVSGDQNFVSLTNSVASEDTVNSPKNQKKSAKKNNQNSSSAVTTNNTNFFSSDAIVNDNLYFSFESPVKNQEIQRNQAQSENSKRNAILTPAKRKSDVISEILENIQLKKSKKSKQPENSVSKQKKNNSDRSSIMTEAEAFVVVDDDSSNSDSDGSIIFLEPDQSNLQTNITKPTVVLSSDSEDSDSSMDKSFAQVCQRKQMGVSNAANSPNNKDLWHINSEDMFRARKQSNRYHQNAVVTCSKCQLKGHSAKFCSVPKAMKCFFCGDSHTGMNCKSKICVKCFQLGHDSRRCFIRFIETCELCRMRGHSERNCPDIWRRYHLTTKKGSIVKGNLNPHSPLFCYNCGSKGHYGAECNETHADRWSFRTWTSVISYKNPASFLRRENQRKFQPDERNSYERSRFDRTPLFHRRKRNERFSKDTPIHNITPPPVQNSKKKKKKSPKTPPTINLPSTSRTKNIVQNEVYFPRTPKMTPTSSTVRVPKKKSKNKGNSHLRQQAMHRIALQQRLGLPFPSTV